MIDVMDTEDTDDLYMLVDKQCLDGHSWVLRNRPTPLTLIGCSFFCYTGGAAGSGGPIAF